MLMLVVTNVYALINYTAFVEATFYAASVGGLLLLRWKRPNASRPIKVSIYCIFFIIPFLLYFCFFVQQVNLVYPISFFAVSIFLVCFPIYSSLTEVLTAIGITITAIPFYYFFIEKKKTPKSVLSASRKKDYISFIKLNSNLTLLTFSGEITQFCQKLFLAVPQSSEE